MATTTIMINNSKSTDLEFDVAIQGLTESTIPNADVRFVVANADGKYNLSVKCVKSEGANKWLARIPPLNLQSSNQSFKVEVIVDGYYFEPAAGSLLLISEPKVNVAEALKPDVTATTTDEGSANPPAPQPKITDVPVDQLHFTADPKFADSMHHAAGLVVKCSQIITQSIEEDGSIADENKDAVAKVIAMGKKTFAAMEFLFFSKNKRTVN